MAEGELGLDPSLKKGYGSSAMKAPLHALVLMLLAGAFSSCIGYTDVSPPMKGYTQKEVYNRGFADGASDGRAGHAHNPHINDSITLSSAYRKNYIWGYTEGYQNAIGGAAVYSAK